MKKDKIDVMTYIQDYLAGVIQQSLSVEDGGIASMVFDDEDESADDIAEVIVNNYSSDYIDSHSENFYTYQNNDVIEKRDLNELKDRDIRPIAIETYDAFVKMIASSFSAASEVVEENRHPIIRKLSEYVSMERILLSDEDDVPSVTM